MRRDRGLARRVLGLGDLDHLQARRDILCQLGNFTDADFAIPGGPMVLAEEAQETDEPASPHFSYRFGKLTCSGWGGAYGLWQ